MDADVNSEKIRTKKDPVYIIRVFTSLVLGWGSGLKAGLAVDLPGILLAAEKESIKEHQKMHHQNFVLIMEK